MVGAAALPRSSRYEPNPRPRSSAVAPARAGFEHAARGATGSRDQRDAVLALPTLSELTDGISSR